MRILIASVLLMLTSIQQSMSASGDTYRCSHIHSYAIDEQGPTKLEKEKDFTFEWRPTTIFFIGSGKEFDIEKTNTSGFTINYSPPGEGLQKQLKKMLRHLQPRMKKTRYRSNSLKFLSNFHFNFYD